MVPVFHLSNKKSRALHFFLAGPKQDDAGILLSAWGRQAPGVLAVKHEAVRCCSGAGSHAGVSCCLRGSKMWSEEPQVVPDPAVWKVCFTQSEMGKSFAGML